MQDKIHVVVDTIAVSNETPLKDDPRCHVLRLIARHGNEEWWDGDRSLEEMFAMVEKTGQLPGTSQPPVGYIHDFFAKIAEEGKKLSILPWIVCSVAPTKPVVWLPNR